MITVNVEACKSDAIEEEYTYKFVIYSVSLRTEKFPLYDEKNYKVNEKAYQLLNSLEVKNVKYNNLRTSP